MLLCNFVADASTFRTIFFQPPPQSKRLFFNFSLTLYADVILTFVSYVDRSDCLEPDSVVPWPFSEKRRTTTDWTLVLRRYRHFAVHFGVTIFRWSAARRRDVWKMTRRCGSQDRPSPRWNMTYLESPRRFTKRFELSGIFYLLDFWVNASSSRMHDGKKNQCQIGLIVSCEAKI